MDIRNKLNLCCGDQILEGWQNLDPRDSIDSKIIKWQWEDGIPFPKDCADVIYIAYGLMYAEKEKYKEYLTQCKEAMTDGAFIIIKEDDDRKRVWKKVGTNHKTGLISSTSNKPELIDLLSDVGFTVIDGYPVEFESVLNTHRRARKNSYILTGVKSLG
jgi:hypothetical protein